MFINKKQVVFYFILFLCLPKLFQAQVAVSWAGQYDLNNYDFFTVFSSSNHTMVTDNDQNLIIGGNFRGSTDFDFSASDLIIQSQTIGYTAFIKKASKSTGLPLWVCSFEQSNFSDCVVDSENNIIVTGYFFSSVDFDPGPGTLFLQGSGTRTLFVVKLSPNGALIWAKRMNAFEALFSTSIDIDKDDNIVLGGSFGDSIDLNPGPIVNMHYSNDDLGNYIVKLDKNGTYLWSHSMNSVSLGQEWLDDIAIDSDNNIYSVGSYYNAMDFDPGPPAEILTSNGWQDLFIQKLDPNGNFEWARSFGGSWTDFAPMIKMGHDNAFFIAGRIAGTVDLNPGQSGIDSVGIFIGYDHFVAKYDLNGNYLWGQNLGESTVEDIEDIIVDSVDNVYITGYFEDSSDLVYGPDSIIVAPNNITDAYIIKLDKNGIFQSHDIITASSECYGKDLAIDNAGSLYFFGYFVGTMDFPNSYPSISTTGDTNACILKLGPWVNSTNSIENELQLSVFPNPTHDVLTIETDGSRTGEVFVYSIVNLHGQVLLRKETTNQIEQLRLKELPQGLYYLRVEQGDQIFQRGIVKR